MTQEELAGIINMNPLRELNVDEGIARRQAEVVLKGYNFLIRESNRFLYIADEVGIGKTYEAMGIAALLRRGSEKTHFHEMILVPSSNLQEKWFSEIRKFIANNYLVCGDSVCRQGKEGKVPAGRLDESCICRQIDPVPEAEANYMIYKMTSFSRVYSEWEEHEEANRKQLESLVERLGEKGEILREVAHTFRHDGDKEMLVRIAFAYLMNARMPEMDLLIVDEAHNLRHGFESHSIRNHVVSRFLGINRSNEEADRKLFEYFPEIREGIHALARKVILLSATPVNSSLTEIKNQLDCVLARHCFQQVAPEKLEEYIQVYLNRFMIRGVMMIDYNGKRYSRNNYRFEHRKGGVERTEQGDFQRLTNDKEAMVMALFQYKLMKEQKRKNNNTFEMGLLAGFETFNLGREEGEGYEERTKLNCRSQAPDEGIVSALYNSYSRAFLGELIPHPKQDRLVNEVFKRLQEGKKSLVFVRRIASVTELAAKIRTKYEEEVARKIEKINARVKNKNLQKYVQQYREKDVLQLLVKLSDDLHSDKFGEVTGVTAGEIKTILFREYTLDSGDAEFKRLLGRQRNLRRLGKDLRKRCYGIVKKALENPPVEEEEERESNAEEEDTGYFFNFTEVSRIFRESRRYKKDWFDLNYAWICREFHLFEEQQPEPETDYPRTKTSENEIIQHCNKTFKRALTEGREKYSAAEAYPDNETFITALLLDSECIDFFCQWIKSQLEKTMGEAKAFFEQLDKLNILLKSLFRQGSGVIPAFIADTLTYNKRGYNPAFKKRLLDLLKQYFPQTIREVNILLRDFQRITCKEFNNKREEEMVKLLGLQAPVIGISGQHQRDKVKTALQFRLPGFPYVLVTTDILKEGEDLHSYCDSVYHYGIAWNPSDMEQRTGRVDRVDSQAYHQIIEAMKKDRTSQEIPFDAKLQVYYPYLADTIEISQMRKLFEKMNHFIDIFYNNLKCGESKDGLFEAEEAVEEIPSQIQGELVSKYDVDQFQEWTCLPENLN